MTASKAQLKAQAKYDKANTIQITLKLNKKTDKDIIDWLYDEANKQGYIKSLIRADIDKTP
jgi:polyphosphate kinase